VRDDRGTWRPFRFDATPIRDEEDDRGVKFAIWPPDAWHRCPSKIAKAGK
jgi:hypothetical protein